MPFPACFTCAHDCGTASRGCARDVEIPQKITQHDKVIRNISGKRGFIRLSDLIKIKGIG